jgi:hypothetical protein
MPLARSPPFCSQRSTPADRATLSTGGRLRPLPRRCGARPSLSHCSRIDARGQAQGQEGRTARNSTLSEWCWGSPLSHVQARDVTTAIKLNGVNAECAAWSDAEARTERMLLAGYCSCEVLLRTKQHIEVTALAGSSADG